MRASGNVGSRQDSSPPVLSLGWPPAPWGYLHLSYLKLNKNLKTQVFTHTGPMPSSPRPHGAGGYHVGEYGELFLIADSSLGRHYPRDFQSLYFLPNRLSRPVATGDSCCLLRETQAVLQAQEKSSVFINHKEDAQNSLFPG